MKVNLGIIAAMLFVVSVGCKGDLFQNTAPLTSVTAVKYDENQQTYLRIVVTFDTHNVDQVKIWLYKPDGDLAKEYTQPSGEILEKGDPIKFEGLDPLLGEWKLTINGYKFSGSDHIYFDLDTHVVVQ